MKNKKTSIFTVLCGLLLLGWIFSFSGSIFANNLFDMIRFRNKSILTQQIITQIRHRQISTLQYEPKPRAICISPDEVETKIYMYHYIRPSHRDKTGGVTWTNSITPGTFEKQIQYLYTLSKNNKTHLAHFSELEKRQKSGCFPNRDITLLMFDDGRRDNYEYVYPIMKKYGLKANLGIIVNRIGFDGKRIDPFMTYTEIKEMNDHPLFEIHSHSMTHKDMRKMTRKEQKEEICGSKKYLEELFHTKINTFVVPMGYTTSAIPSLAESCGYTYTLLTRPGTVNARELQNTPHQLERIRVRRNMTGKELFEGYEE